MKQLGAWIMLVCATFAGIAQAQTWEKYIEVNQVMGDHDSRSRAREWALEKMRMQAASAVGKIVESVRELSGETLTVEVREVGVNLVRIAEVVESVSVNAAGAVVLSVKAKVSVDSEELKNRAIAMARDRSKAAAVRKLGEENKALRLTLQEISDSVIRGSAHSQVRADLERHAQVMKSLSANSAKLGNSFEAGAIVQEAKTGSFDLQEVEARAVEAVFERAMQSVVTLKVEHVSSEGDDVNMLVRVGWALNLKDVARDLEKHFRVSNAKRIGNVVQVERAANGTGAAPSVMSELVLERLYKKRLTLELRVGESTVAIPVVFVGREVWETMHCSRPVAAGHDVWQRNSSLCVLGDPLGQNKIESLATGSNSNPVRLRVPAEQANRAGALKAVWVMSVKDGEKTLRTERAADLGT